IVHVHKKPYKDVYIWHYEYSHGKRHVLEIALKTDFFKKRAKRRIYIKLHDEPLNPPCQKEKGAAEREQEQKEEIEAEKGAQ
ncbi:MAG: hypothetical protein ACTSRZ_20545, partial [Promethearchaeota archaeon]